MANTNRGDFVEAEANFLENVLLQLLVPPFVPHELILRELVNAQQRVEGFTLSRPALEVVKGVGERSLGVLKFGCDVEAGDASVHLLETEFRCLI